MLTIATRFQNKIVADSAGNKLLLSTVPLSGVTAFTVSADAAGAALGISTTATPANDVDFEIRVSNPSVADSFIPVTLTSVNDIAQVIAAIQAAATAAGAAGAIQVVVNESKTGLTLKDTTFNENGPNARTFMITPVNGSAAATGLGIAGVDATSAAERDGKIDGGPIIGIKLTDRFFLQNATLEATLEISIDGTGTPLDPAIDASANFGFVGIELGGDAVLSAAFSIGLADPSDTGHDGPNGANKNGPADDGKVSLTEFIKGLSTPSVLLAQPTLTGGGSAFLTIDVNGVPFIDVPNPGMPGAPKITIDVLNVGDVFNTYPDMVDLAGVTIERAMDGKSFTLTGDFRDRMAKGAKVSLGPDFETFATTVAFGSGLTTVTIVADDVLPLSLSGLAIGTPTLPAIDFKFENLEELVSFDNLDFSFGSIIDALLMVRDLLSEFEGVQGVLAKPIPLVDVSINDLLDFADKFSDALTQAQNNPAASLQLLDQKISEAFGVAASSDLIAFTLDDIGTPSKLDDLIKISLNLGAGFNRSLNVSLPGLNLPEPFNDVVDFGGAATLSAEGSATFSLDIGIRLSDP